MRTKNSYNMKNVTLLLSGLILLSLVNQNTVKGQAPDWTRLLQTNTNGVEMINLVTADAVNSWFVGRICGQVTFSGIAYTSVGFYDLLLVKMAGSGSPVWVKQINAQAGGTITPDAIKTDGAGNIFLAATFSGIVTLGGRTLVSTASQNSFMAKFDNSGNCVWATTFLSTGTLNSEIALDGSANSFLVSKSNKLLKFSAAGVKLWEQAFADRTLQALAVVGNQLFLGGTLQGGTTNFGTMVLTSLGGYNTGFLVKADLAGNYSGSLVVGGSTQGDGSSVSDILADNSGNLVITGCYTKDLVLGTVTITHTSRSYYTYIAKCDNNFAFSWATSSSLFLNTSREMWTYRLFSDNTGNIYEYGMIGSSFQYGNVSLNLVSREQFLVKFDASGNPLKGYALQNSSFDRTMVNPSGKILSGGYFNADGDALFGNFFMSQYDNNLVVEWQDFSSNCFSGSAKICYIKHDAAGNTYLQSRIIGQCDFFGTPINTSHYLTVVSKHDVAGNLLWMKQIQDISPHLFGSVFTLDKSNNVVTAGLFQGSLVVGTTTLSTLQSQEGYVASFSSDGQFLWASKFNLGQDISVDFTIATDNDRNVLVTGVADPANYLIKFNPSGTKLWSKSFPMESYYVSMVSADAGNNIYMTSEIHLSDQTGSTTIGSVTLTQTYNDGSTALIKFDPNGNALWAYTYGGVAGATYSDGWPCDIRTDGAGNTWLWGWCPDHATFGNTTLTNPYTPNQKYSYYLTKISSSGAVLWAKAIYESTYSFNYGDLLDLDAKGNVYVGGHFNKKINIDGTEFLPEGSNDFFVVRYSGAGVYSWMNTIPSNSLIINSLSVFDENVVSMAGYAGKNATLGNFSLVKKGGSNCIVATLGKIPLLVPEINKPVTHLYPNPVKDLLFIKGNNGRYAVSVEDMNGITVIRRQDVSGSLDVSRLSSGVYVVKLETKDGTVAERIIKL